MAQISLTELTDPTEIDSVLFGESATFNSQGAVPWALFDAWMDSERYLTASVVDPCAARAIGGGASFNCNTAPDDVYLVWDPDNGWLTKDQLGVWRDMDGNVICGEVGVTCASPCSKIYDVSVPAGYTHSDGYYMQSVDGRYNEDSIIAALKMTGSGNSVPRIYRDTDNYIKMDAFWVKYDFDGNVIDSGTDPLNTGVIGNFLWYTATKTATVLQTNQFVYLQVAEATGTPLAKLLNPIDGTVTSWNYSSDLNDAISDGLGIVQLGDYIYSARNYKVYKIDASNGNVVDIGDLPNEGLSWSIITDPVDERLFIVERSITNWIKIVEIDPNDLSVGDSWQSAGDFTASIGYTFVSNDYAAFIRYGGSLVGITSMPIAPGGGTGIAITNSVYSTSTDQYMQLIGLNHAVVGNITACFAPP